MDIVAEIKDRVTMVEVLSHYGVYPVRGTNIYRCFVHSDQKPSANIIKGTNQFHCFSCQWSGDIFAVIQHFEQCDFKKALRILDDRYELGLYKTLSHKEKLELARRQKERERARREKLYWEEFGRQTSIAIADRLKLWEQIGKDCHLTRAEYRSGNWKLADLYFHALKKFDFLSWLYDTLNGHENYNSHYTHIFGADSQALLKRIAKGEIEI